MPRGLPPTLNVAVTLSVAISITVTEAEPSLDTYANGAASALSVIVAEMTVAQIMNRANMTIFLLRAMRRAVMESLPAIGYATRVRGNPSAPRSWQRFDNAAQIRFGSECSSQCWPP